MIKKFTLLLLVVVISIGCVSTLIPEKKQVNYYYTGIIFTEIEGNQFTHEIYCADKIVYFEEDLKEVCLNCDGTAVIKGDKVYNSKGEELRYENIKVLETVNADGQKQMFERVTNYKLNKKECIE